MKIVAAALLAASLAVNGWCSATRPRLCEHLLCGRHELSHQLQLRAAALVLGLVMVPFN
jgi:hypothetical protein